MAQELNVGRLVRVVVNLAPIAAARRGFGTLLVLGDSGIINAVERFRSYADLTSVATDFGTSASEYLAAVLYFGQTPKPQTLMIGRWLRTASAAILNGGILTTAEQAIGNFTSITDGEFDIDIDSVTENVTVCDFSGETNLNGVAAEIQARLLVAGSSATCVWDGAKFIITSATTGVTSLITTMGISGGGTDITALLKMDAALAETPIPGFDAEEPVDAIVALADVSGAWYGVTFAASTQPTDDQLVTAAGTVEGLSPARLFGVTETGTDVLVALTTTDLASRMQTLAYKQTFVQYSQNANAAASLFGRIFSVNFAANRSTLTAMFKIEPGVAAENLSETQAQTLKAKACNVFVAYQNDTDIIQYGVVSSGAYIDEIHGLDWFSDALQTEMYNLLYLSKTKIPQTEAGQNQLVTVASKVCDEAVFNGLVAPGQWNADGFGQLATGDFLQEGYYIFSAPIADQSQSIRDQRIAPPIQIALKLAGAIHEIDCIVDVNR